MRSNLRVICIVVAVAMRARMTSAQSVTPPDSIVVTHGRISAGGRSLSYTARAGQLPLLINDTGELMGRIFFVSYTLDRAPGSPPRPLTFIWNGGPGSSASQSHVVGFGPKHLKTADTYPQWGESDQSRMVDNPETWLVTSDLVFVDPPGTGYSRATSVANRDLLYTTHGDAEAVAEFIRLYRTRFNAWNAPIFLAGESYGTTRAMYVSEMLERRRDHVSGVLLISGFYNVGQQVPSSLSQGLGISLYAATGHYHKRLAPELEALPRDSAVAEAVNWARRVYAPALAKRDSLSENEKTAIRTGLQHYTGIDPKNLDPRTLTISKDQFMDRLLDDRGLELGRYDSRLTGKARGADVPWSPLSDPSLQPMLDLMQGTSVVFNSYLRDSLHYQSDLLYRGPFGEAFHPTPLTVVGGFLYDDWMAVMFKTEGGGGRGARGGAGTPPDSSAGRGRATANASRADEPPLRRAMTLNPRMRVGVMDGMFDASCAANDEAVARTDAALRARVTTYCYAAGHMIYTDASTRRQAQRDFAAFVQAALSTR